MTFFAAVAAFALSSGRAAAMEGAPDLARWRDLRLWAVGVMALQVAIYACF